MLAASWTRAVRMNSNGSVASLVARRLDVDGLEMPFTAESSGAPRGVSLQVQCGRALQGAVDDAVRADATSLVRFMISGAVYVCIYA